MRSEDRDVISWNCEYLLLDLPQPRAPASVVSRRRFTGGKLTTAAGERVSPIAAGARSGCRVSAPSSHLGMPAWHPHRKRPAR